MNESLDLFIGDVIVIKSHTLFYKKLQCPHGLKSWAKKLLSSFLFLVKIKNVWPKWVKLFSDRSKI